MKNKIKITDLTAQEVRFPLFHQISAAYVTLYTNDATLKGYGLTFTEGSEQWHAAFAALKQFIVGKDLSSLTEHMGEFWQHMRGISQVVSPAAIVNAVWDVWARREKKPLWRLIVDMSPEELVRCLDFRDIADAVTPDEVLALLRNNAITKGKRIADLLATGYPAAMKSDPRSLGAHDHHRVTDKPLHAVKEIDFCRLGGVNEILTVLLMAAKLKMPVSSSACDMGLSEYIQHLAMVDYIYISGSLENRALDYVDHLREHLAEPVILKNGHYQLPTAPGYSIEMKEASLLKYNYPHGQVWRTQ